MLKLGRQRRRRLGVGTGLIEDVDRLVGLGAVEHEAVGEHLRGDDRLVGDGDGVVVLEPRAAGAEDLERLLGGQLADDQRLEAPLERRIALHPPVVLHLRGGADHADVGPHQGGLQHVGGVHRDADRRALPDEVVHLVHEEDDVGFVLERLHQPADPRLELSAVDRAREECDVVEGDEARAAQRRRHLPRDDALRQPLDDRGLADARGADQRRVVLRLPQQDVHAAGDLVLAAAHRLEVAAPRGRVQVVAEPPEGLLAGLRRGARLVTVHAAGLRPLPAGRALTAGTSAPRTTR